MARRDNPLYRDTSDKMLGGVCSGLAHYFDVDTMLVRAIFVASAMFGGGFIVYVILWLVLDPAPVVLPPPSVPDIVPDIVLDEHAESAAPDVGLTSRDEGVRAQTGWSSGPENPRRDENPDENNAPE